MGTGTSGVPGFRTVTEIMGLKGEPGAAAIYPQDELKILQNILPGPENFRGHSSDQPLGFSSNGCRKRWAEVADEIPAAARPHRDFFNRPGAARGGIRPNHPRRGPRKNIFRPEEEFRCTNSARCWGAQNFFCAWTRWSCTWPPQCQNANRPRCSARRPSGAGVRGSAGMNWRWATGSCKTHPAVHLRQENKPYPCIWSASRWRRCWQKARALLLK